jgi:hypothetical protein
MIPVGCIETDQYRSLFAPRRTSLTPRRTGAETKYISDQIDSALPSLRPFEVHSDIHSGDAATRSKIYEGEATCARSRVDTSANFPTCETIL